MKTARKTNRRKISRTAHKASETFHRPDNTPVVITMVVDESSSMTALFDATCSGFNEYLATIRRTLADRRAHFSAITFNTSGIRTLQHGAALSETVVLGRHNYRPAGGTPLLDAVGQAITATEDVVRAAWCVGARVVVVIQTDGEENASAKFGLADIKTMIEDRQAKGWEFVFIGAGINAFADGARMGIHSMNTMSYTADVECSRNTFGSMACNTAAYATGASGTMNFSVGQSVASGEDAGIIFAKLRAAKDQQPKGSAK
jgi:hypothetical protein